MKQQAASGALFGAMLGAPLVGVFYLAHALAALPFVPFDIFDWMARMLPGAVLTFGIDTLVKIIGGLHMGQTASASKSAEHMMAIAGLVITAAIAGAVFFALRARRKRNYFAGIILGAILGIPISWISARINTGTGAVIGSIWIVLAFVAWGLLLESVRARLAATGPSAVETRATIERIDRRELFARVLGASAAVTTLAVVIGKMVGFNRATAPATAPATAEKRWSETHPLPNADAVVKPVAGTRPELTPLDQHYRIDIDSMPAEIDEKSWKLKIAGLVEKPLELTLDQIRRNYEPMHQFITLACISNPIGGDLVGTTRWTGASLQRLLPDFGLRQNATHLKIKSSDGFYEIVPLATIRSDPRVMLTYAWDGVPLLADHGFPLRIYIPDVYGMKQPKWIVSMEATDRWEEGYWVARGWDAKAQVKATSVIDVVASDHIQIRNGQKIVPVGGIARAGARGISRVEVKVDDGPWEQAQLRTPLADTTWVIWRYEWPFAAGRHKFTVRCFDGSGTPQIEIEEPPHPRGASGLDSMTVKL